MARVVYKGFDLPDGTEIPDVPADLEKVVDGITTAGKVPTWAYNNVAAATKVSETYGSAIYTADVNGDILVETLSPAGAIAGVWAAIVTPQNATAVMLAVTGTAATKFNVRVYAPGGTAASGITIALGWHFWRFT